MCVMSFFAAYACLYPLHPLLVLILRRSLYWLRIHYVAKDPLHDQSQCCHQNKLAFGIILWEQSLVIMKCEF